MRFERPGAQASDAAAVSSTGAASLEKLSETEKVTMQIAHDSDRVARKELMEQTGVGKMKAAETLKRLAEKGPLEWVGSNQHDPRQYYRAVAGSSGSYRALPATFGVGSRCRLPPRSATRGAGLQRSSLLSRRKRKAGRGFCAGGEDCWQSRWSISSRLGRIGQSE